jgi:hypothetical protein
MNQPSPQIGFDRFIQLDWAAAALQVRLGTATTETLTELLDASHSGPAAKKKTRTVLNRLWLEPHPDLVEFSDRGVQIVRRAPDTSVAALTWGMAIATYPFFGRVAEIVGRLTTLQGDCTSAAVHRRMAEIYGEREGTRRMTNMVLQSQANWGAIDRQNQGKQIVRKDPIEIQGSDVVPWLVEACIRHTGRFLPIATLDSHPLVYPFRLGSSLSYTLAGCDFLEMRVDGAGNQIVGLSV